MPPTGLQDNPLPVFVDLNTIRSMTKVAKSMAVIKVAIGEIAGYETVLTDGTASGQQRAHAAQMVQKFAGLVAKETTKAMGLVHKMKTQVRMYERELKDAVG